MLKKCIISRIGKHITIGEGVPCIAAALGKRQCYREGWKGLKKGLAYL
jgi:hypothetical protein